MFHLSFESKIFFRHVPGFDYRVLRVQRNTKSFQISNVYCDLIVVYSLTSKGPQSNVIFMLCSTLINSFKYFMCRSSLHAVVTQPDADGEIRIYFAYGGKNGVAIIKSIDFLVCGRVDYVL